MRSRNINNCKNIWLIIMVNNVLFIFDMDHLSGIIFEYSRDLPIRVILTLTEKFS